ncbi:hypothetical protein QYE76_033569 [Lolium multiflorum]|uniref:Integrase catalytic domain-containing protein n=1 Tax=Lolium multiflorum TaxID=4521 RepID=A0AAD8QXA3_LOLMU|nr:hypothetical protein QYE76_033569 [Lolium multiflorum]
MWVELLKAKDEAARAIVMFEATTELECGHKLRVLRTDRGGEFTSVTLYEHCTETRVQRHLTVPYTAQHNSGGNGEKHAQGQASTEPVLGRGGDHDGVHPQPLFHQERGWHDTVRGMAWKKTRHWEATERESFVKLEGGCVICYEECTPFNGVKGVNFNIHREENINEE